MADPKDRNVEDRFDERQRAEGADAGREGYGDDGGTRVGRPDTGRDADVSTGPSSQTTKEGLEGAVFEGEGTGNTGAGGEAAQGIYDAQGSGTGRGTAGGSLGGADRHDGPESLADRQQEHKSGYGGEGGAPRTSSDQRE